MKLKGIVYDLIRADENPLCGRTSKRVDGVIKSLNRAGYTILQSNYISSFDIYKKDSTAINESLKRVGAIADRFVISFGDTGLNDFLSKYRLPKN